MKVGKVGDEVGEGTRSGECGAEPARVDRVFFTLIFKSNVPGISVQIIVGRDGACYVQVRKAAWYS